MKIENKTFEIHITNEDAKQNAKVLAFTRFRKRKKIKKSSEGKEVRSIKLALHSPENEFINRLKKDEDLLNEFLETDNDVELELDGKRIERTSTILLTAEKELCYNFTEYEIKKDRKGKIVPCEVCGGGEIYCEHRIKKQIQRNINDDEIPITWIKKYMIDKKEILRIWSFEKSYQIVHTNGLTYDFLFKMAKALHDSNKVVFIAPIVDKEPQKLVIRQGQHPFYGWLEGRIQDDKYALILHGTTFRLSD